jgi:hypothetical protein
MARSNVFLCAGCNELSIANAMPEACNAFREALRAHIEAAR